MKFFKGKKKKSGDESTASVSSARSTANTSGKRLSMMTTGNIIEDEPLNTDKPIYDTFESWLESDSNESFRLKKFKESDNTKLSLTGQLKSPADGDIIPHLIRSDTQITSLNISDSNIGVNRIIAAIEALKFNTTLKFIGLSFNEIDLDGCFAIQDVLTVNQTLTSIDLKNNKVEDDGFEVLMDALKTNNTITDIDLRRNNITAEACHALNDVLLTNTTLQKLELRGNSIGDEGCLKIMEGLDNNTTLVTLGLDRNNIKPEQVEKCNVIVKRNEVIQRHRESIKSEGISYYVTSVCTLKDKMCLAWAETDSGKVIDEAAKTVGGIALSIFMEQLRIIMDSENTQLAHTSDPQILQLMRDKRQLKKLLDQKINSHTYITHTIAASKHPRSLDMLKCLVDECNASFYTEVDSDGLTARAITLTSEIEAKRAYAITHGTFLGRYIIDGGKGLKSNPAYKSSTSIVYFAHDVSKTENDSKYQVAIKIMTCEKSFLKVRRVSEGESLNTFVSGEDIPRSSGRYDANAIVALYRFHDEIDTTGKHYQCLVFQKEGKNLHQIINSEFVAGNDETTIPNYGLKIAKCIQHVHSKGYIHGDIKPRNIIRSSKNNMKLVDLDDSVALGEKLTKQNVTSAFISPEYARALYGYKCKEEDEKSMQEQINELHEKMIKLDLSKNEDIDTYQVTNEYIQSLLSKDACKNKSEEHLLASPLVDIWGFGVIMYYLCVGRPLFLYNLSSNFATESEKNRLLMWRGLSRTDLDEVPTCYNDHFRESVKTFLMKCLHVDQAERFQSMEEVLDHDIFLDIDDI